MLTYLQYNVHIQCAYMYTLYVHVAPSGQADSPVVAMNSPTVSATDEFTDSGDISVSAEKPPETRPERKESMLAEVDGGEVEGAGGEVERGGGGERVMEGAGDGEGGVEVGESEVKLDSGGIADTQNKTVEQVHVHVYVYDCICLHINTDPMYIVKSSMHIYIHDVYIIPGAYEPPKAARSVQLRIIAQNGVCIYSST